jgi:hypothetical protein
MQVRRLSAARDPVTRPRDSPSCKRQVSGSNPLTGSQAKVGRQPSRLRKRRKRACHHDAGAAYGITVYPPREGEGRWRAEWQEDGQRQLAAGLQSAGQRSHDSPVPRLTAQRGRSRQLSAV